MLVQTIQAAHFTMLGQSVPTDIEGLLCKLFWTAHQTHSISPEVQLEVGDKATPFEHRSFSEELQSCRRYFYAQQPKGLTSQATNDANCILGTSYGANNVYAVVEFQTEMRTYPAVSSGGTWYARETTASALPARLELNAGEETITRWGKRRGLIVQELLCGVSRAMVLICILMRSYR